MQPIDVARLIPQQVKESRNPLPDYLSPALIASLEAADISCYVVNRGYSSYLPLRGGLIIASLEQAVNIATKYRLSVRQACDAIVLHELGHATMSVAKVNQVPPGRDKECLAWLLGRVFLHLTSVPSEIYTQLSIELLED